MISLSIIIPCFNEARNLPKFFLALEEFSRTNKDFALEWIFVNDGSTDATDRLLERFSVKHQGTVRVITSPKNRGKGFAVRSGMLQATGEWRLFVDADLAVPLEEIRKMLPHMQSDCAVVIGSRVIAGSSILVPQSRTRSFLGRCYTSLAKSVTGAGISDYTCGFKCFSKKAAQVIFPKTRIDRWSFDAEILYLAQKHALAISEVGITWRNGPETKVRLTSDAARSFLDLLRIVRIHR